MTSPAAQKAAGEILDAISVHDDLRLIAKETNRDDCVALFSPIIQHAITEAIDAAVAAERAFWQKRIAELQPNGMEEK